MQYKLLTILGLIILGAISAIYWKLDAYQHNLPLTLRSPMTLHTVVSKLPEDAYIRGMDVIEEKERTLTVALKPSHDASDMVNQYAKARKDNYTLLASLLSADATRALDPSLEREATYVALTP